MQMKKTKNKGKIKTTIMIIVITIILLLLAFSEDIMKLTTKNEINLAQNVENETGIGEPNVPTISAGMIPVKWDGTNWVITTKTDADWYDYSNGKPAYIMLNDGVYQSELIQDMTNKKLAEENIGAQIQESELGTIFTWIPRFTYNTKDEIQYTQVETELGEDWTTPEMFMYLANDETKPDYSLSGIWLEEKVDNSYSSKINEMNKEEGKYGFLAHTKAVQINKTDTDILQKYVGNDNLVVPLNDITSKNRIILKIINERKQNPIKAKASFSKDTGLITVQVTYTQYGIKEIIHEGTNKLQFSKVEGIIQADTSGISLEDGLNTIKIIDNNGNEKNLKVTVLSAIYAVLYDDKTLAFGKTANPIPEKAVYHSFGDISGLSTSNTPWNNWNIKYVDFVDKISPISTESWFYIRDNPLIEIKHIYNLNTSNVTNMRRMFYNCSKLTELDVSNFDTSNVTDMEYMFFGCSGITELDVSHFNTSNVTTMERMFCNCSGITELDVSHFNTSNVTTMQTMFGKCSSLTELDVSKFDTSSVTDMSYMFYECSGITELDVSHFNTSNVTTMQTMFGKCSSLTELDLISFDTSNVTTMRDMFYYCSGLTELNLTSFNTKQVTSMFRVFCACRNLTELDLTSFDTSNVTDMEYLFQSCTKLKNIYVSRTTWKLASNRTDMFTGCGTSSVTYVD